HAEPVDILVLTGAAQQHEVADAVGSDRFEHQYRIDSAALGCDGGFSEGHGTRNEQGVVRIPPAGVINAARRQQNRSGCACRFYEAPVVEELHSLRGFTERHNLAGDDNCWLTVHELRVSVDGLAGVPTTADQH